MVDSCGAVAIVACFRIIATIQGRDPGMIAGKDPGSKAKWCRVRGFGNVDYFETGATRKYGTE